MSTKLLTDVVLAERLALMTDDGDADVAKLHRLRVRHGWPCVKLGRYDVRFTEQQAEQIIASLTKPQRTAKKDEPKNGLTSRSAKAAS